MISNIMLTFQLRDHAAPCCFYTPNAQEMIRAKQSDQTIAEYMPLSTNDIETHINNIVGNNIVDPSSDKIVGGYFKVSNIASLKPKEVILYRVDQIGKFIIYTSNTKARKANKFFYNTCKRLNSIKEPTTAQMHAIFLKLKEQFESPALISTMQNDRLITNLSAVTTHILDKTNPGLGENESIHEVECMVLGSQVIFQARTTI